MIINGQDLDLGDRLIFHQYAVCYWILGYHWKNSIYNRREAVIIINSYGDELHHTDVEVEKCYMCPSIVEPGWWRECTKRKKDGVKAIRVVLLFNKEGE